MVKGLCRYRQIEEMMGERSVEVDHSTLHRWLLKYVPALQQAFRTRKPPVERDHLGNRLMGISATQLGAPGIQKQTNGSVRNLQPSRDLLRCHATRHQLQARH